MVRAIIREQQAYAMASIFPAPEERLTFVRPPTMSPIPPYLSRRATNCSITRLQQSRKSRGSYMPNTSHHKKKKKNCVTAATGGITRAETLTKQQKSNGRPRRTNGDRVHVLTRRRGQNMYQVPRRGTNAYCAIIDWIDWSWFGQHKNKKGNRTPSAKKT